MNLCLSWANWKQVLKEALPRSGKQSILALSASSHSLQLPQGWIFVPLDNCKKPGMVVHTFNPSTWRAEVGGSL